MNDDQFIYWLTNDNNNYDKKLSIEDNINKLRERAIFSDRGHTFLSHIHLNIMDPHTELKIKQLNEQCKKEGMFYFLSDKIKMMSNGEWVYDQTVNSDIDVYAEITCVDKIKVMTAPRMSFNMSKFHSFFGLENTQDQTGRTSDADIFLHEVNKIGGPIGPIATIARYKRNELGFKLHAHTIPKYNRCNMNMPRGIHEYVLVNRALIAHYQANTSPHGQMVVSISKKAENNNSLTVDSFINAVINGTTFKANATCNSEHGVNRIKSFKLVPLAAFGTHQTLVECNRSKKDVKELSEIQVHEHCFNCSAIPGSSIIREICKKGCSIMGDPNIITSIALNNCKSFLSNGSRSLTWNTLNAFCNALCWKFETHKMTPLKEMEFYRKTCIPLLNKLTVSRDNYAQATHFCQQTPLPNLLYGIHDFKLISHKFRNKNTNELFKKNTTRFSHLYTSFITQRNSKKPLTASYKKKFGQITKNYREATLVGPSARNESIVLAYEHGPKVFRQRSRLRPPDITEI